MGVSRHFFYSKILHYIRIEIKTNKRNQIFELQQAKGMLWVGVKKVQKDCILVGRTVLVSRSVCAVVARNP